MSRSRVLMLVSAAADAQLRGEVAEAARPRPEYLVLEAEHGVELLDWSRLPGGGRVRTRWRSTVHVAVALRRMARYDVVFSDGEHLGLPLALAMRSLRLKMPHLVIGHHLTTGSKSRLLRDLRLHEGMSRILVHSAHQRDLAQSRLGIPAYKIAEVPYYADTTFWRPLDVDDESLVVSAGREHRDYATLAAAGAGLSARFHVAAGSVHSPASTAIYPPIWPANFARGFAGYKALRDLYARARVVVVPLVETDFQAGVTTVLEAMAMGKPVIVTATRGTSGAIVHDVTGLCVPPGDAGALRDAIRRLLANPADRVRLGRAAREAVLVGHTVEGYGRRLADHLSDLTLHPKPVAA